MTSWPVRRPFGPGRFVVSPPCCGAPLAWPGTGIGTAICRGNTGRGMNYVFQFGDVWAAWPDLLWGCWLTIQLSAVSMLLGLCVAVLGALGKTMGPKPVRWLIDAYVEVIRNTPFLVQIFIIFF